MKQATVIRLAGVMGFLGVALGAFGAHGLQEALLKNERVDTWETAVLYHLVHAVALLALGMRGSPSKVVSIAFATGIVIFSGSLYVLSLSGLTKLGMITPLGGVAFLVGWGALVLQARSEPSQS